MKLQKRDDYIANSPFGKRLREQMDVIEEAFYGWLSKPSDLTKDGYGVFSQKQARGLVSAIMSTFTFNDDDRDFLEPFLYLTIRAQSAGISKVLVPEGWDFMVKGETANLAPKGLLKPITEGDFRGLKEAYKKGRVENAYDDCNFFREGSLNLCTVSFSMASTITTIYTMLTGKRVAFPNPYEKEMDEYRECLEKNVKAQQKDDEYMYSEEYWEDVEYWKNEERDYVSLPHDEMDRKETSIEEDIYIMHTNMFPGNTRTPNMDKYLKKNVFYSSSRNRSGKKENQIYKDMRSADYKRDREELLLNFDEPKSFITAFDHVCNNKNLAKYRGIEACVPEMLDLFLYEYKVNPLSNEAEFFEFYSVMEEALRRVLKLSKETYNG